MARTDHGSRSIAGSRERIYNALTERESLEQWLPPGGMTGRIERFDPAVGGGFRMVLSYLDPREGRGKSTDADDVTEVEFAELVPNERAVWRVAFESDDPTYAGTMTMTWRLSDADAGTEVRVIAEDVPTGIAREEHETGIDSSLANLAAYVEARPADI
jgi:uncharacterized protein YndB with AHSA1/START domain